ncbi:MAG: hypothetical protein EOO40_06755 [Deltaproteobacteria bacterium]|nr:MAG: hypothetical protein EOO40_06755 [Deltaproteobacteria bacterium]
MHAFRDTDLLLRGPIVGEAVRHFFDDIARRAPDLYPAAMRAFAPVQQGLCAVPPMGCGAARLVNNDPQAKQRGRTLGRLFACYCEAVPAADTIIISNGYFLPVPTIVQTIVRAAKRGVLFKILCNGPHGHDLLGRLVGFGTISLLRRLFALCPSGSLEVWLWQADPATNLCAMHHKVALLGLQGTVLVGSANFDAVSERSNYESAVALDDVSVRREFLRSFAADVRRPNVRRVRRCDVEAVSWPLRLLQGGLRRTLGKRL